MKSYKMVTLTMPQDRALYETFEKDDGLGRDRLDWHDIGLKYLDMKFSTDFHDRGNQWTINCKIINEKLFTFACIKAGITPKITSVRDLVN
jgi:hypothetical protein